MILQWDESFDIGSGTLTGVNDADYQPPFPLTAKLNKLTIKVDRPTLTEEDIKKLENIEATAVDGQPIHHLQACQAVSHAQEMHRNSQFLTSAPSTSREVCHKEN